VHIGSPVSGGSGRDARPRHLRPTPRDHCAPDRARAVNVRARPSVAPAHPDRCHWSQAPVCCRRLTFVLGGYSARSPSRFTSARVGARVRGGRRRHAAREGATVFRQTRRGVVTDLPTVRRAESSGVRSDAGRSIPLSATLAAAAQLARRAARRSARCRHADAVVADVIGAALGVIQTQLSGAGCAARLAARGHQMKLERTATRGTVRLIPRQDPEALRLCPL
jgi:hypothetical protein